MTLEELQFVRKMLKQGTAVSSDTFKQVVWHAIEATEQLEALKARTERGRRNGAAK